MEPLKCVKCSAMEMYINNLPATMVRKISRQLSCTCKRNDQVVPQITKKAKQGKQ